MNQKMKAAYFLAIAVCVVGTIVILQNVIGADEPDPEREKAYYSMFHNNSYTLGLSDEQRDKMLDCFLEREETYKTIINHKVSMSNAIFCGLKTNMDVYEANKSNNTNR